MTQTVVNVFADTAYWIALLDLRDPHHAAAAEWSRRLAGRMITTHAVLMELANAFARPPRRDLAVRLIDHLHERTDVTVVDLDPSQWSQGYALYRARHDKAWSLTDCLSFVVMQDHGLTAALTSDDHFRQAGFRALLLEEPS